LQPIHLARIIECPCLSTPRGVTSYHKPPAPLLIKQGMGGITFRTKIKKRRKIERGEMGACYSDRCLVKVRLIAISSQLPNWQEFSFNILALVSVKINLAPSYLSSDRGEGWRSEERGDEKNWSGEVGQAVLG